MMAYLEAANRKPPRNDQERAEAYRTMNAYTGRYRVEGNQWVTKVDAAWNVEWVGVEQARSFTLSGDQLKVTSQWNVNELYGGKVARGHLTLGIRMAPRSIGIRWPSDNTESALPMR